MITFQFHCFTFYNWCSIHICMFHMKNMLQKTKKNRIKIIYYNVQIHWFEMNCSKRDVIHCLNTIPSKMPRTCKNSMPSKSLYYMEMWCTSCSGHSAPKGKRPQYPLHEQQSVHIWGQKEKPLPCPESNQYKSYSVPSLMELSCPQAYRNI